MNLFKRFFGSRSQPTPQPPPTSTDETKQIPDDGKVSGKCVAGTDFQVVENRVFWGSGHNAVFNDQYTPIEVDWLLGGALFPVGTTLTGAECNTLLNGNLPAALQIVLFSNKKFNRHQTSEESHKDALCLIVSKLYLSFAVRNNVPFLEAERAFTDAMGLSKQAVAQTEGLSTGAQQATTRGGGGIRELTLDLGNGVSMKLVRIPAGKFLMGSPETEKIAQG